MGGGDLNLKKSWHPQTLRNVEKVWKAEQKAEAEAKKIEQLRRELDEERQREEMQRYAIDQGIVKKKSDRLEWMYAAPGHTGANHEEYLLGKAIDKAVDPLAVSDEKNASAPGATFMDDGAANSGADLAAKIRDDPLFMIKKKENEKKKELLKNPVRMKQLQQILKADLATKAKKKGKKDKKKSKKEKRKKDFSDENKHRKDRKESDSSEDSDRHINDSSNSCYQRREYLKHSGQDNGDYRSQHNHTVHKKTRSQHSSTLSEDVKTPAYKRHSQNDSDNYRDNYHKQGQVSSRSSSPTRKKVQKHNNRKHSKNLIHHESRDHRDNSSCSRRRHRSRSHSPFTSSRFSSRKMLNSDSSKPQQKESGVKRKMTEEERERKLAEMMDNAKWRDEQRGKNVKRYKEEEEDEARETVRHKEKEAGASFVRPMKVQTFTSSTASVENRIKRNIHSLQRTPAALENFLRKK